MMYGHPAANHCDFENPYSCMFAPCRFGLHCCLCREHRQSFVGMSRHIYLRFWWLPPLFLEIS